MADVVMRNGEVVDGPLISMDVGAEALCLGHTLFETMLVRTLGADGLFRLDAHIDRLRCSVEGLGWASPRDWNAVAAWVREAARRFRAARVGSGRLRLTAVWTSVHGPPDVLVKVVPYKAPDGPARAVTTAVRVPWTFVAGVSAPKSGSRVAYSFAERLAQQCGGDEALLVDAEGRLAEGAKSNLFVAIDERLVTPPLSSGILPGIARATLIALAEDEGMPVDQRPIGREEVSRDSVLFLSNALWGIRPVGELDGVPLVTATGRVKRVIERYRLEVERRTT